MTLKDTLRSIQKKFGESVVNVGVDNSIKTKFSLGSPMLDFCTYNSLPEGIFIEASGAEGSGKTLVGYLIAADYIRKEKKKDESIRRKILYVDAEGTADSYWAKTSTGYDMNDKEIETICITPTGQSAEQIFDIVRECVQTEEIGLVIFDSLTAIAPQLTINESFEKKEMGGIAKPLADFVKRCTGLFNKTKTTFYGVMGDINNISGYGNPITTPGGTYWKRACSLRIKCKKSTPFDEDGNELKTTAENPAGHIIEVAFLKSKFCRNDRKLGYFHLNYRRGIDIMQDLLDVAIHIGLIDNSTQGWYKLIDLDTGELMLDKDGKEIKIRGNKNLKPYFEEHLELYRKLYDAVYDKISIKEDPNIKSFEEMLGIDMNKELSMIYDEEEEYLKVDNN